MARQGNCSFLPLNASYLFYFQAFKPSAFFMECVMKLLVCCSVGNLASKQRNEFENNTQRRKERDNGGDRGKVNKS